jgi:hypothetical protein
VKISRPILLMCASARLVLRLPLIFSTSEADVSPHERDARAYTKSRCQPA